MGERIEVPLELDDFDVIGSELIDEVLEVHVRSTFPAACTHCGSVAVTGHGWNLRRLRDRSRGCPTVLVWNQRRFRCRDCGRTSRERHPGVCGRRAITHRFRRQLFDEACRAPFSDVAGAHGVSHYRVIDAFDAHAHRAVVDVGRPRVLAIDESAFRRGFLYHSVLFDPEARCALDVIDGRDQWAAERLLGGLSAQVKAGVETVVIDCHWPYRKAIEALLPDARIVADKFHVLRAVAESAQRVRRRLGSRLTKDPTRHGVALHRHSRRLLVRSRWSFARRVESLTDDDRATLGALFAAAPEVAAAYWMKEAFFAIYDASTRQEAERRLEVWETNLHAAGLAELTQSWANLQRWREPILAYFDDRQTNALAEGLTNKIKVMKRRGYGHRNEGRYRARILLTCGRRPTG